MSLKFENKDCLIGKQVLTFLPTSTVMFMPFPLEGGAGQHHPHVRLPVIYKIFAELERHRFLPHFIDCHARCVSLVLNTSPTLARRTACSSGSACPSTLIYLWLRIFPYPTKTEWLWSHFCQPKIRFLKN